MEDRLVLPTGDDEERRGNRCGEPQRIARSRTSVAKNPGE
jgi:hypothetical protein